MKSRSLYFWLSSAFLLVQLVATGLLFYVTVHTQAIHYFNGWGNPFRDNPIPLADITTAFLVADAAMLIGHIYYCRRNRRPLDKLSMVLIPLVFMAGLTMLLYLHNGPLGSCMAIPDECGG